MYAEKDIPSGSCCTAGFVTDAELGTCNDNHISVTRYNRQSRVAGAVKQQAWRHGASTSKEVSSTKRESSVCRLFSSGKRCLRRSLAVRNGSNASRSLRGTLA